MSRFNLGTLAGWTHEPEGPPKANILMIHGIGEHSARHLNTVNFLLGQGFHVTRFDLRGAGESGGRRQWVQAFSEYVDDANSVYNWMRTELPRRPMFVHGHSLGGAIAIRFAAHRSAELNGLSLSAPAFRVEGTISPIKIKVGLFINRFASTVKLPKNVRPIGISRDPEAVQAYVDDPLSVHYNTVGQGAAILNELPNTLTAVAKIQCPVFLTHGTSDSIVRVEGSFDILRALKTEAELWTIPGGFHEPHNDLDKDNYFEWLGRWLAQQLIKSPAVDKT